MKKSFLFPAIGVVAVAALAVWMMGQTKRVDVQPAVPVERSVSSGKTQTSPPSEPGNPAVGTGDIARLAATNAQPVADPVNRNRTELKIPLPPKLILGTPKTVKNVNIADNDPALTLKPRQPFFVPLGDDVLLSAGKKVTSSDTVPPVLGSLEQITDGVKKGDDGYFVVLAPGKQWIQIDLGDTCRISAVLVWHFHMAAVVYRDVVVQVSDDPDFKANVVTLFNNDNDNTLGFGAGTDREYFDIYEGKLIDGKGVGGRYVRLYSNGNTTDDLNHYIEVEVYGRKG